MTLRIHFRPTFGPELILTVRDHELELLWRAGDDLGLVTATVPAADLAALPPFPEGDADLAARDGIAIDAELGPRAVYATSPTAGEAPAHHRYFTAVLALALRHAPAGPIAQVLADVAAYLRP